MARQMKTYSNVELRGTVCFLRAKRLTSMEIYHEILAVYGPRAISWPVMVKWCKQSEDGRTEVRDAEVKEDQQRSEHLLWYNG